MDKESVLKARYEANITAFLRALQGPNLPLFVAVPPGTQIGGGQPPPHDLRAETFDATLLEDPPRTSTRTLSTNDKIGMMVEQQRRQRRKR